MTPETKDEPGAQNDAAKKEKCSKERPKNQPRGNRRQQSTQSRRVIHSYRRTGRSGLAPHMAPLASHQSPLVGPISFGTGGAGKSLPVSAAQQLVSHAGMGASGGPYAAATSVALDLRTAAGRLAGICGPGITGMRTVVALGTVGYGGGGMI
jgi:hypothetical protein